MLSPIFLLIQGGKLINFRSGPKTAYLSKVLAAVKSVIKL